MTKNYYYDGGRLIAEKWSTGAYLLYHYDENSSIYAVTYSSTGSGYAKYYLLKNLQGDVVQILNSTNGVVANYSYDAWGNVVSVTNASGNAITSTTNFANINPIRYRGYYYDSETGFYYLKSRYYDPANCRFISADSQMDFGNGTTNLNLFAYCANDPVNNFDPNGDSFLATIIVCVVVGAVVGGTIGGVTSYNSAKSDGISGTDLFWETVEGAGKGALIGGAIGGLVGTNISVISTYGASSTFGTATISGTATIGAKFTEVTALQWKSSSARDQDAWHTVDECVDSVFANGHKILTPVALKPLTTYGAYNWTDITKHKVVGLRFNDYLSSPGGKILPSIFVTLAWDHTRKSIFCDDPITRARERSYIVK